MSVGSQHRRESSAASAFIASRCVCCVCSMSLALSCVPVAWCLLLSAVPRSSDGAVLLRLRASAARVTPKRQSRLAKGATHVTQRRSAPRQQGMEGAGRDRGGGSGRCCSCSCSCRSRCGRRCSAPCRRREQWGRPAVSSPDSPPVSRMHHRRRRAGAPLRVSSASARPLDFSEVRRAAARARANRNSQQQ